MKIFWSWQSDTPGKIGRHFVRDALEAAVNALKEESEITDAFREAEVDHDRKGVPGSPDLAATILQKIEKSDVVVADVTPIGETAFEAKQHKRQINSNVAIELGYALKALGNESILMVMNEAFGSRNDLPFDLRHKAGPIIYRLPTDASKEEISAQRKKLVSAFKIALREMAQRRPIVSRSPINLVSATPDNPGRYFDKSEPIANVSQPFDEDRQFFCRADSLLYIRIQPTIDHGRLGRVEAEELFFNEKLPVMNPRANNPTSSPNEYGAINFSCNWDACEITAATQLFTNKEIWGFDTYLLSRGACIPTAFEHCIAWTLQKYLYFANDKLGISGPINIEIGVTNVKGYSFIMPSNYLDRKWGTVYENCVIGKYQLNEPTVKEVDQILLSYFESLFDAAGCRRPRSLNNFPSDEPGSLPDLPF